MARTLPVNSIKSVAWFWLSQVAVVYKEYKHVVEPVDSSKKKYFFFVCV